MAKKALLILVFLVMVSCETNMVFSEYRSLNNGVWQMKDTVGFDFLTADTTAAHNVFINVRNDNEYQFSNLFLITELGFPSGETVIDTLEYEMALPDGSWLGKGVGSIKENKLWLRENIVFPDSGVYNFKISHAMRENGKVQGVNELEGITDIGIQIEKTQ